MNPAILVCALLGIGSMSCVLPNSEWENVNSDHVSTLNVFGLISLDETVPSFVMVHQTLGLEDKKDDDWSFDVKDATVTIYAGSSEYIFKYLDTGNNFPEVTGGKYSNTSFNPQPNTLYTLAVSTPDGRHLSGETITPVFPKLDNGSVPDTVFAQKPYTVAFNIGGPYFASLRTVQSGWSICGADHYALIHPGTTQWTTPPTDCSGWWRGDNDGATDFLTISLVNMDDNYYEYFLKQRPDDDFVDFLTGSGRTAVSIGVEGGYGIFGAIAADRIYRVIIP